MFERRPQLLRRRSEVRRQVGSGAGLRFLRQRLDHLPDRISQLAQGPLVFRRAGLMLVRDAVAPLGAEYCGLRVGEDVVAGWGPEELHGNDAAPMGRTRSGA